MAKRIGLLTAGSDCPGLNAAIRAVGKTAIGSFGMEVVGFLDGFQGLIEDHAIEIEGNALSGILTAGGTILGTSRELPHEAMRNNQVIDMTEKALETYARHELDALVCIGGRETQESALNLKQKGLNIITLPKAIDNDVNVTDTAIGFDSAVEIAAQSIDRLHSTAHSHHRIIIVEVMGRNTGWLTLGSGIAGGADVILIPEIPYDIAKVTEAIARRNKAGKGFSIIAVAERTVSVEQVAFSERLHQMNAMLRSGSDKEIVDKRLEEIQRQRSGTTFHVSNLLKEFTGLETRITILGYLLRGGAPTATERIIATHLGSACANLIHEKHFGVMVGMQNGRIAPIPLEDVKGSHKLVPLDHPWVKAARQVGTHLGDD